MQSQRKEEATRYRNGDTLKSRKWNWIEKVCRITWEVFFFKVLHTLEIYLQSVKIIKIVYIEELKNRSLPPLPSPYRQQDGNECDKRRSNLGIDSMDKLSNFRARENYHCLQYQILVHLEEIYLEFFLNGRCSCCPTKEPGQKICFRNVLISYWTKNH